MKQISINLMNLPAEVDAGVIGDAAKSLAMMAWKMGAGKVTYNLIGDGKKNHG